MQLRDYQKDLLSRVEDALDADTDARVMMQLPTGGGKTVIAGELLKKRLTGGRKAVWLTHRKELADQTCGMLTEHGIDAEATRHWKKGTDAPSRGRGVAILMALTVGKRAEKMEVWNRYDERDLMIIDEAHHAPAESYKRAMDQWPGQVVGITGTPWRLKKDEGFAHLFRKLVCGSQVGDLQSEGALCDAKVLIPSFDERIVGGEEISQEDYAPAGIERANSKNVMTAGALRFWRQHASDRQTIVYAVSLGHADNLERVFRDGGVPSAAIHTKTPRAKRDRTISDFKDGSIQVLINVEIATEGFDLPDASCILITRPTLSLTLFMQMVGRGLRPKEDGGDCLILDMAANSDIHGLPEDIRQWTLDPRGEESEGGEVPITWCQECGTASPAASHNCSNCGKPLGKECPLCRRFDVWMCWNFEHHCGDKHKLVCDHCHIDVHYDADLPVRPPLDELDYPDEYDTDIDDEEDETGWLPVSSSSSEEVVGNKPSLLRTPTEEFEVTHWNEVLVEVVEWLIDDGRLSERAISQNEDLRHWIRRTRRGLRTAEELSNGRFIEVSLGAKQILRRVEDLVEFSGSDAQFYVSLAE